MVFFAACSSSRPSDDTTLSLSAPGQFSGLKTSDWNVYAPTATPIVGVYQDSGQSFVDPIFKTTVKRIGASAAAVAQDSAITSIMPFYAKQQAWSSDLGYLVTWANDGAIQLYDGGHGMNGHTPYQLIRMLGGSSGFKGCGTDNEIRWSTDPATPQKFFHSCFAKFYSYDAATNTDTLLVDWAARFPGKGYAYVNEDAEGNPSSIKDPASGMYNRYWAFDAADSSGATKDVIVYDRFTDKSAPAAACSSNAACGIVAQVAGSSLTVCPGGGGIDWVGMSPTGKYVIIDYGNTGLSQGSHAGCGIGAYSPSLVWQRQLLPTDWHADVGFDAQNNEVLVGFYEPTTSWTPTSEAAEFSSVRLSDGLRTRMQLWGNDSAGHLQSMLGGQAGLEYHMSMRGTVDPTHGIPGYALISWYNGSKSSTLAQYGATLFGSGEQNILYIPGDGSVAQAKVWRINQTRSFYEGYDDEPHCVPSPDFTKTLCGTNWANVSTELPVYPLVTELAASSSPPPPPPPSDMASSPSPDMATPPPPPPDMASSTGSVFAVSVNNASPAAGGTIAATFTAPSGEASTDIVGVFSAGAADWSWQVAYRTQGATSGSMQFVAPTALGKYEVRYVNTTTWTTKATVAICVGGGC
jgi:hypothetical protein